VAAGLQRQDWSRAPGLVESAIGTKPKLATSAVISTGRSWLSALCTAASKGERSASVFSTLPRKERNLSRFWEEQPPET
jgi:hypothetical protein